VSSFIPCPPELLPYCAASWKINDRIGATLAPVEKSISGSGNLTNNNTVQVEEPRNGRMFIGPAAYFDFSQNEALWSSDLDLMPGSQDYTLAGIIWHNNDAQFGTNTHLYHCFGIHNNRLTIGAAETNIWRQRMILRVGTTVISSYFDEDPVGAWTEPLVAVLAHDVTNSQTRAYFQLLYSGHQLPTLTHSGTYTLVAGDTLVLGRYTTAVATTYNASRPVQDCWTVLQGRAANNADAVAFRNHFISQRKLVETFIRGNAA